MRTRVFALLLAVAACSPIEQQEGSYAHRLSRVQDLAGSAEGRSKDELLARKADIERRYASLPSDKKARSEALGKLNQELNATIDTFGPRIESESKSKGQSQQAERLKSLTGTWRGGGVSLEIDAGGGIRYTKQSGAGSKSLTAKITKIDGSSFEAGALGVTTTFKVDSWPKESGGQWRMSVDGVEVIRE